MPTKLRQVSGCGFDANPAPRQFSYSCLEPDRCANAPLCTAASRFCTACRRKATGPESIRGLISHTSAEGGAAMMKPCRIQAISLILVGMLLLPACGLRDQSSELTGPPVMARNLDMRLDDVVFY